IAPSPRTTTARTPVVPSSTPIACSRAGATGATLPPRLAACKREVAERRRTARAPWRRPARDAVRVRDGSGCCARRRRRARNEQRCARHALVAGGRRDRDLVPLGGEGHPVARAVTADLRRDRHPAARRRERAHL